MLEGELQERLDVVGRRDAEPELVVEGLERNHPRLQALALAMGRELARRFPKALGSDDDVVGSAGAKRGQRGHRSRLGLGDGRGRVSEVPVSGRRFEVNGAAGAGRPVHESGCRRTADVEHQGVVAGESRDVNRARSDGGEAGTVRDRHVTSWIRDVEAVDVDDVERDPALEHRSRR